MTWDSRFDFSEKVVTLGNDRENGGLDGKRRMCIPMTSNYEYVGNRTT
jgi:hypothetical protein